MRTTHRRRASLAGLCGALAAPTLTAANAQAVDAGLAAAASSPRPAPIVRVTDGAVRGDAHHWSFWAAG